MENLIELIQNNQPYLINRFHFYAKKHDYHKYMPTLETAWVQLIAGISGSLTECLALYQEPPEIYLDFDLSSEPISRFGVTIAQWHRQRGVSLEMFLGLLKYFRQTYVDLLLENIKDPSVRSESIHWIQRFFDITEIAFCKEWNDKSRDELLQELQAANRNLTNEKNKYLTIFESISTPVILVDANGFCSYTNTAASHLLDLPEIGGRTSPADKTHGLELPRAEYAIPWLIDEYRAFQANDDAEFTVEKTLVTPTQGQKILYICFHRMLDISGKFSGTAITLADITERKEIEDQLRYLSYHDVLTGLHNRTYLVQELRKLAEGKINPISILSFDVDGLKLVNDSLGHYAGDMLMTWVAKILTSCFGQDAILTRLSGDEFLVVLPHADSTAAELACRKIRDKLEEHNAIHANAPLSVAVGWASGKVQSHLDIRELMKKADARMYLAKKVSHTKFEALLRRRIDMHGTQLFRQ